MIEHPRVHVNLDRFCPYGSQPAVWARGTAFYNGCKLTGIDLAKYTSHYVRDLDTFLEHLNCLNGFYALVLWRQGFSLYAAVDRVRSIPLFYAQTPRELFLSDDPRWIQAALGPPILDPLMAAEFLLTGYVTGSCTLDPRIQQLQAGEALVWQTVPTATGASLRSYRYYRFTHRNHFEESEKYLLQALDKVTLDAVQRLIRFADGRPIAVPLSGGLDSRLIVMTLKRLNYRNVTAFSYGSPSNNEAGVSRSVAGQLGMPWHFTAYTPELWRQWYSSNQWQRYTSMAENLVSVAHIQDWPAIMEMKRKGDLQPEAVIVPGHSADFVAGSHIPDEFLGLRRLSLERVARAIWDHHYVHTRPAVAGGVLEGLINEYDVRPSLLHRIHEVLCSWRTAPSGEDLGSQAVDLEQVTDAYEYWDWQERQAKFIVNSVRVYDFWGYAWWLPWWDADFMRFWERVPVQYRIKKHLYDKYVHGIQEGLGISIGENIGPAKYRQRLKAVLHRLKLIELARRAYAMCRVRREYVTHPLAWYGIIDFARYYSLLRHGGNINTILAHDQIYAHLQRLP